MINRVRIREQLLYLIQFIQECHWDTIAQQLSRRPDSIRHARSHGWRDGLPAARCPATARRFRRREALAQALMRQCEERMIVLSDTALHAADRDPSNLQLCQRGAWQDRLLVETVRSMLTVVGHCKRVMHRVWASFHARLAFTRAAFNVLVQWQGFQPYASGFVPLSIAEFGL